jgi:hypothetical protein
MCEYYLPQVPNGMHVQYFVSRILGEPVNLHLFSMRCFSPTPFFWGAARIPRSADAVSFLEARGAKEVRCVS